MKKLIAIKDDSKINVSNIVKVIKNSPLNISLGENNVDKFFINKNPNVSQEQGFCEKYQLYVVDDEEKIKENTFTVKEGFNGDWFWNSKYNFIARIGDITEFDFKIIATTDTNLNLPLIDNVSEDLLHLINKKVDFVIIGNRMVCVYPFYPICNSIECKHNVKINKHQHGECMHPNGSNCATTDECIFESKEGDNKIVKTIPFNPDESPIEEDHIIESAGDTYAYKQLESDDKLTRIDLANIRRDFVNGAKFYRSLIKNGK
jgi:hypothetical protein